jgi:hypothetical protein
MDDLTRARHYKDAAEKLRSFAGQDDRIETRKALLSVAESYDQLAGQYLASAGANRNWRR